MRDFALRSYVINLADAHDLRYCELIEALELSGGDNELSFRTRHLGTQVLCSNLRRRVIQLCNRLTCLDSLPDIGHPDNTSSYDAGDVCIGATNDRAWDPAMYRYQTRGDRADLHGYGRPRWLICGVPSPGGDNSQK